MLGKAVYTGFHWGIHEQLLDRYGHHFNFKGYDFDFLKSYLFVIIASISAKQIAYPIHTVHSRMIMHIRGN
jgi:hypothetical protein